MQLTPLQLLLANLGGSLRKDMMGYMEQQVAYERLKGYSGQDFGYDVDSWSKWIKENEEPFPYRSEYWRSRVEDEAKDS